MYFSCNICILSLAISLVTDVRIRAVSSERPLLLMFELCMFILYSVHPQRWPGMFPVCMITVHAKWNPVCIMWLCVFVCFLLLCFPFFDLEIYFLIHLFFWLNILVMSVFCNNTNQRKGIFFVMHLRMINRCSYFLIFYLMVCNLKCELKSSQKRTN